MTVTKCNLMVTVNALTVTKCNLMVTVNAPNHD